MDENSKYYKIGDFAKLTGVTIKSLRYYDKINVLNPAYIDENTGYRYYLPEQAILINIIKLCLLLDLPLKSLVEDNYSSSQNKKSPNLQKIIETGTKKAEERLIETKNMLSLLNDISSQTKRLGKKHEEKEIYNTTFPSRKVLVSFWDMKKHKEQDYIKKIAFLTSRAKELELNVLTQQGLLSDYKTNSSYVFITVEGEYSGKDSLYFPEGNYTCLNLKERDLKNLKQITKEQNVPSYRYAFFLNTDIYDFCLDHPLHMMEVQCYN